MTLSPRALAAAWLISTLSLPSAYAQSGDGSGNASCANAIALGRTFNSAELFDTGGGAPSSLPWTCVAGTPTELWYSYTPPVTSRSFSVFADCNGTLAIEIFEGTCGSLTSIGCGDNACGGGNSPTVNPSVPGQRYLIRIGATVQRVSGSLWIEDNRNEVCGTAYALTEGEVVEFDTRESSSQSGPSWQCLGNDGSYWFSYTVPANATGFTVDYGGGTVTGGAIEVFEGDCTALTSIYCDVDLPGMPLQPATIDPAVPGATYLFRYGRSTITGINGSFGAVRVTDIVPPVPNDRCTGALPLTEGISEAFNTSMATPSPNPLLCPMVTPGPDLWYSYTVPQNVVRFTVGTCESGNFDTMIEAYRGDCSNLVPLGCGDIGCGNGPEIHGAVAVDPAVPGETYHFRVGGPFGLSGGGVIRVEAFESRPVLCLETPFNGDELGLEGSVVYFDLEAINHTTLEAIAANYEAVPGPGGSGTVGLEMYVRAGTHVGNETAGGWTLAARDDGTAFPAPANAPTYLSLDRTVVLPRGRTGIALVAVGARPRYTVGDGTNQVFVSPDGNLRLTGGSAADMPFSGFLYEPRVWNGQLFCSETPPQATCLENGSFEAGDFSSWTQVDNPNPFIPSAVVPAGPVFGTFFAVEPQDGMWAAILSADGSPGTAVLSRDVSVTEGLTPLTFNFRAGWNISSAAMGRTFDVTVRDPLTGSLLQSERALTITPGIFVSDTGTRIGQLDLSQWVGQTVRVGFEVMIPESFTGPALLQIDNLRCPDFPGWPIGENYCSSETHSTGRIGTMGAFGSSRAGDNFVTLSASLLPPNQFGIFFVSATQGFSPGANGTSNGNLCVGGMIGRYNNVRNSGQFGRYQLPLDLTAIPQGSGSVAVMAGQSWNFQSWFRDTVGLGSNFTDGLSILFD